MNWALCYIKELLLILFGVIIAGWLGFKNSPQLEILTEVSAGKMA